MFAKNQNYLNLLESLFLAFVTGSGIIGLWSRLRSNITIMSTTSRMTTIAPTKLHNNEYSQQGYNDTTYKVTIMSTTSRTTMKPPTKLHNNEYDQQDDNDVTYKLTR